MALKPAIKKKLSDAKEAIKKKNASRMNVAHVSAQAQEYMKLKEEENALTKKIAEINKDLKELLPLMEETTKDEKGNLILDLPDADLYVKLEARLSTILDQEDAIAYAKKRGLENKLVYTQEVADMSAFEQLNLQGVIPDKDFENLVTTKETTALKILPKKDEETSTVQTN